MVCDVDRVGRGFVPTGGSSVRHRFSGGRPALSVRGAQPGCELGPRCVDRQVAIGTPRNRCWWAVVNVLVRRKYSLTIDAAERDALDEVIESENCAESPWLAYLALPDLDSLRPLPAPEPTALAIGGALALPVTLASTSAGNQTRTSANSDTALPLALYDDNGNGRITCAEAKAHDIAPVGADHPAYAYMNDRDGDGVVCE